MNWREEELRQWCRFISDEELPSLMSQIFVLSYTLYSYGTLISCIWPLGTMILTHFLYDSVHRLKRERQKVYSLVALSWASQVIIFAVTVTLGRDGIIAHLMLSTIVLTIGEVTPLLSRKFNVLVIIKHVLLWNLIAWYEGIHQLLHFWSLLSSIWCVYHLSLYVSSRQQLLSRAVCIETRRDEQEKLVSLVLAIPDGVVVVTEDQKIAAYNHMFLEQMGLGQTVSYAELYSQVEKLKYDPNLPESPTSTLKDDILAFIRSDCSSIRNFKPVVVNGRYLEWRGKLGQWDDKMVCIATVRDSTQWVELEKTAKNESLQKSALLRSVSHELRTPVNAVINQTVELYDRADDDMRGELEIVISSAKLLLSMIGDLLDLSQIHYNKLMLSKSLFKLQPVMKECFQLFKPQCQAKNLSFHLVYDPNLPDTVLSDESRLKQVILHLLSNAVKFTLHGSIQLIAMQSASSKLKVTVRDTGIGIAEGDLQKIFLMYSRVGSESRGQVCGLGLSISSALVQKLGGGSISVVSSVGKGSSFSFEIDVSEDAETLADCTDDEDAVIDDDSSSPLIIPRSFSSVHDFNSPHKYPEILIVDDVPFNRVVARKMLESGGFLCDEASTGLQALNIFKRRNSQSRPFRVVLMDIDMPEMDGISATRAILSLSAIPAPAIIGCSAYCSEEDRAAGLQAGMRLYLFKPISRVQLLEVVRQFVLLRPVL